MLQPLRGSGQIFDSIVAWSPGSDGLGRLQCRKPLIHATSLEKQERFLTFNKLQTLPFCAFSRESAAFKGGCHYIGCLLCAPNFFQAGCVISANHKIVPHARMKIEKSFVILRSFLIIEIV